jgi:hypothetical protein
VEWSEGEWRGVEGRLGLDAGSDGSGRLGRPEPGTNPAPALCQPLRPEPAQDAIGAGSKHPHRAMQPRFIDCSRI